MVITYINYDGQESPMLHTKLREIRPACSGEDFGRVFTVFTFSYRKARVSKFDLAVKKVKVTPGSSFI